MKKSLCFILFLIPLGLAFGQNWNLLNTHEVFNFRWKNSNFATHSIWVDSFAVGNRDTTYFLNRIVGYPDTCPAPQGSPQFNPCYPRLNYNQFLMEKAVRFPGNRWSFYAPDTFAILPLTPAGGIWLFDSLNNISATVVAADTATIYGMQDSIKTISLSNGDTLVLSKNFGVQRFPSLISQFEYRQSGIEGRNIGEVLPKLRDFFPHQAGDRMEFRVSRQEERSWSSETVKITIDSVFWDLDTLEILGSGISRARFWLGSNPSGPYVTPNYSVHYKIVDSTNHPLNLHPKQAVRIPSQALPVYTSEPEGRPCGVNSCFSRMNYSVNNSGNFQKHIGISGIANGRLYFSGSSASGSVYQVGETYKNLVQPNVGLQSYSINGFEHSGSWELKAAEFAAGDTFGTFTPDHVLLSREIKLEEKIQVFPNPVQNTFTVLSSGPDFLDIQLFDLNGRLQKSWIQKEQEQNFEVEGLENGLYLLQIKTQEGVMRKKLLISN